MLHEHVYPRVGCASSAREHVPASLKWGRVLLGHPAKKIKRGHNGGCHTLKDEDVVPIGDVVPLRYRLNLPNFHVGELSLVHMLLRLIGTSKRIWLIGDGFMVLMLMDCNNLPYDYLGR